MAIQLHAGARASANWGLASHKKTRCTRYPSARRERSHGARNRLANVVSNPKLTRAAATSSILANITRPAAIATVSGANPDSPTAIGSALTYSRTARASRSKNGAAIVLPAPIRPSHYHHRGRVSARRLNQETSGVHLVAAALAAASTAAHAILVGASIACRCIPHGGFQSALRAVGIQILTASAPCRKKRCAA